MVGLTGGVPTDSFCASAPDGETNMDVQLVLGMAPGADIYIYYGSGDDDLMAMATAPVICHQLTSSFGLADTQITRQALLQFAAQGQSFFHASGDGGNLVWDSLLSSPYVTAVAATELCMQGAGVAISSESVNFINGGFVADGTAIDGCGDPQPAMPIPWYQIGIKATNVGWNSGVSEAYRNVPDVSIAGDWQEYDINLNRTAGGATSAASPTFAGFMALVNEQSHNNGLGPVGLANPALYAIARTNGIFNDITQGKAEKATCSKGAGTCSCNFDLNAGNPAGTGYDLATGLGTPSLALLNQLASNTPSPTLDVSAGYAHTCAIKSDNSLWCWGYNSDGELGDGSTTPRLTPVKVFGISTAQKVSAGLFSTCALLNDQSIQCWGANDYGQLGDGSLANSSVPVVVAGITNATAISVGGNHACALLSDGSVKCWGYNGAGQLGNGTTNDSVLPVTVSGLTSALSISAGAYHSCAVLSDGTAQCWGLNSLGELGNGTDADSNVPTAVSGVTTAMQISAGWTHTCAALGNGTVQCWGSNMYGNLGHGGTDGTLVPVNVSNITTATVVSCNSDHCCALLSDQTVQCWGVNEDGELGDVTTNDSSVPVAVQTITPKSAILSISAGLTHACARSQGAVFCWGDNSDGELGDGSTLDRYIPEPVHFW
jgi:alpha-tubulin suppressor-like RCC1 family protein